MKRGEEKPLTWGWHPRGHEQRSMWAGPACAFTLPEKLESLSFWSCPLGFRRERFPDVFSAPDMPRLAGAILNFREALDLRVWVHGKCFCLTCNPISTDADFLPSLGVLWRTHPPFISWLVPIVWEIGQGDTNVPKIPRRDQLLTSKSQRLWIRGTEDEWFTATLQAVRSPGQPDWQVLGLHSKEQSIRDDDGGFVASWESPRMLRETRKRVSLKLSYNYVPRALWGQMNDRKSRQWNILPRGHPAVKIRKQGLAPSILADTSSFHS